MGPLAKRGLKALIPPPENAALTQIIGTLPTYEKAGSLLQARGAAGRGLDFGAGLGEGVKRLPGQWDTYEPFAKKWQPTYNEISQIPEEAYGQLTNLNVLNVVPREIRDEIVQGIGRSLEPGGLGVLTTRGRDVMSAKGVPGPEPMSIITSRDTYQKGFTNPELQEYLRYILGNRFDVEPAKLGPAGALIRKKASGGLAHLAGGSAVAKAAKEAFKKKFTPGFYHGTGSRDIKEFAPSFRGATFVTRDPKFAESFLPIDEEASAAVKSGLAYQPGATVYPLSVNMGKHFDVDTPEGLEFVKKHIQTPGGKHFSVEDFLGQNNWSTIEDRNFVRALKNAGYDTFSVNEGGVKNVGVFDPKNLRGRFAEFDPAQAESADFMKAKGGLATPAWQRKEGQNPEGGLNAKGRASYNRETGGNLKAPQPEGGPRRDSFCARMKGMKKKLTSAETANDPDSRINKALRKWSC